MIFESLLTELKEIFLLNGLTLSTAESCTGGLIGAVVTSLPGSSMFYDGSVVVYSNLQKIKLLNIDKALLDEYGAVSEECSLEMAKNLKKITGSSVTVSTTGIAGPAGGTRLKPVGRVYSSVCFQESINTFRFDFSGTRNEIRIKTVEAVLQKLILLLKSCNYHILFEERF